MKGPPDKGKQIDRLLLPPPSLRGAPHALYSPTLRPFCLIVECDRVIPFHLRAKPAYTYHPQHHHGRACASCSRSPAQTQGEQPCIIWWPLQTRQHRRGGKCHHIGYIRRTVLTGRATYQPRRGSVALGGGHRAEPSRVACAHVSQLCGMQSPLTRKRSTQQLTQRRLHWNGRPKSDG